MWLNGDGSTVCWSSIVPAGLCSKKEASLSWDAAPLATAQSSACSTSSRACFACISTPTSHNPAQPPRSLAQRRRPQLEPRARSSSPRAASPPPPRRTSTRPVHTRRLPQSSEPKASAQRVLFATRAQMAECPPAAAPTPRSAPLPCILYRRQMMQHRRYAGNSIVPRGGPTRGSLCPPGSRRRSCLLTPLRMRMG